MLLKTYIFILLVIVFITNAGVVRAQETFEGSARVITANEYAQSFDFRVANLEKYLRSHKSPLAEYAKEFVEASDKAGIDYRLVPAITGVESTFGKRIPKSSYNAYGWANGEYVFTTWEDSINHVSESLKIKYIDSGAGTITKIAKRYAPPSKTWGRNVVFFMKKIDRIPLTFNIEG